MPSHAPGSSPPGSCVSAASSEQPGLVQLIGCARQGVCDENNRIMMENNSNFHDDCDDGIEYEK